jgi:hypothetical protein
MPLRRCGWIDRGRAELKFHKLTHLSSMRLNWLRVLQIGLTS